MWDAEWGGSQPQPWCYNLISPPPYLYLYNLSNVLIKKMKKNKFKFCTWELTLVGTILSCGGGGGDKIVHMGFETSWAFLVRWRVAAVVVKLRTWELTLVGIFWCGGGGGHVRRRLHRYMTINYSIRRRRRCAAAAPTAVKLRTWESTLTGIFGAAAAAAWVMFCVRVFFVPLRFLFKTRNFITALDGCKTM